jgi:hypothetical protein
VLESEIVSLGQHTLKKILVLQRQKVAITLLYIIDYQFIAPLNPGLEREGRCTVCHRI